MCRLLFIPHIFKLTRTSQDCCSTSSYLRPVTRRVWAGTFREFFWNKKTFGTREEQNHRTTQRYQDLKILKYCQNSSHELLSIPIFSFGFPWHACILLLLFACHRISNTVRGKVLKHTPLPIYYWFAYFLQIMSNCRAVRTPINQQDLPTWYP